MNCPKHPYQKMTLLFTSAVCDVCDPPKPATRLELIKQRMRKFNDWNQTLRSVFKVAK